MKQLVIHNRFFILLTGVFLLILGVIIIIFDKASLHLAFNQLHHPASDFLFKYITWFGDGYFAALLCIAFLFIKFRYAISLVIASLMTAVFSQFFKRVVFPSSPRPIKYFQGIADLHLVDGVDMHGNFSFPSGHTTTVFCMMFCLAAFTNNKTLKACFFIIALLTAISRVYLSQHFFIDIFAGTILGSAIAFFTLYLMKKPGHPFFEKSLFNLKSK